MNDTQNLLKILVTTGNRYETGIGSLWKQVVETGLQSEFIKEVLAGDAKNIINYLLRHNTLSSSDVKKLLDKSDVLGSIPARDRYIAIMVADKNASLNLRDLILEKILKRDPDNFLIDTISILLKKYRGQLSEVQFKKILDYNNEYAKVGETKYREFMNYSIITDLLSQPNVPESIISVLLGTKYQKNVLRNCKLNYQQIDGIIASDELYRKGDTSGLEYLLTKQSLTKSQIKTVVDKLVKTRHPMASFSDEIPMEIINISYYKCNTYMCRYFIEKFQSSSGFKTLADTMAINNTSGSVLLPLYNALSVNARNKKLRHQTNYIDVLQKVKNQILKTPDFIKFLGKNNLDFININQNEKLMDKVFDKYIATKLLHYRPVFSDIS